MNNKQDAMKELNELRQEFDSRTTALEKIINAPDKPESPPFGKFWDGCEEDAEWGYLVEIGHDSPYKYRTGRGVGYRRFQPITEAILPQMIEHDGEECPVNSGDIVICFYHNKKDTANGEASYARNRLWKAIKSYQIIKRAES